MWIGGGPIYRPLYKVHTYRGLVCIPMSNHLPWPSLASSSFLCTRKSLIESPVQPLWIPLSTIYVFRCPIRQVQMGLGKPSPSSPPPRPVRERPAQTSKTLPLSFQSLASVTSVLRHPTTMYMYACYSFLAPAGMWGPSHLHTNTTICWVHPPPSLYLQGLCLW